MPRHSQTFPSTREASTEASSFVLEAAAALEIPEDVMDALLLATGEAVSNAAGHGNGYDPAKRVVVECARQDDEVYLCVEDEGPGVPVGRLESAALPDDPFDTSGRGLYIMKSLAERVWLECEGRRLCLMWRLDSERAA